MIKLLHNKKAKTVHNAIIDLIKSEFVTIEKKPNPKKQYTC